MTEDPRVEAMIAMSPWEMDDKEAHERTEIAKKRLANLDAADEAAGWKRVLASIADLPDKWDARADEERFRENLLSSPASARQDCAAPAAPISIASKWTQNSTIHLANSTPGSPVRTRS